MSKDISKALKKKTDAQLRLLEQDAAPIVRESNTGENFIADPNEYSQQLLAGKNITITTAGNTKTINAVMGLLAGDNITISAPDEEGKVTISGTVSDGSINGKDVSIADYTGKDGYVLSYDETNDQFVLTEASGGGSDYTLPQATESALGGIKAKEKTTESAEVAIDTSTGKLFAPEIGGGDPDLIIYSEGGSITETFEDENFIIEPSVVVGWSKASAGYNSINRLMTELAGTTSIDYSIEFNCAVAGKISFWHRQDLRYTSYGQYTGLGVHLNGTKILSTRNDNSTTWRYFEYDCPAGNNILKFTRDSTNTGADSRLSLDDISIPAGGVYGMDAVTNNPNCLLKTSENGDVIGFKPMVEMMEKQQGETLPTASADLRGQIFTLQGAAGVADISYICQKDATDAYVWQQI